ncbi:unnamed protein product, partial [Bubo scandiacus]
LDKLSSSKNFEVVSFSVTSIAISVSFSIGCPCPTSWQGWDRGGTGWGRLLLPMGTPQLKGLSLCNSYCCWTECGKEGGENKSPVLLTSPSAGMTLEGFVTSDGDLKCMLIFSLLSLVYLTSKLVLRTVLALW